MQRRTVGSKHILQECNLAQDVALLVVDWSFDEGFAVVPEFVSQVRQFAQRLPTILAGPTGYIHGVAGKKTPEPLGAAHRISPRIPVPSRAARRPVEQVGLTLVVRAGV